MSKQEYADGGDLLSNSHRVIAEERRIAVHLRGIRDGCLYTEDGYRSFAEFCEKEFGLSHVTAENMIRSLDYYEASLN